MNTVLKPSRNASDENAESPRYKDAPEVIVKDLQKATGVGRVEYSGGAPRQGQLQQLGFTLNFRKVPQDTLYTRFCNVPGSGWICCQRSG